MKFYTEESLENLSQKVDLVKVVSSFVDLKKEKGVYKGMCPFHKGTFPHLVIKEEESIYHCFGCGAHGDAITFVMNILNMSFFKAVKFLGVIFNIELEKAVSAKEEEVKVIYEFICEPEEESNDAYDLQIFQIAPRMYDTLIEISDYLKGYRKGYCQDDADRMEDTISDLICESGVHKIEG